MRKIVDERVRTLIENGIKTRHRSFFVILGDKSRKRIMNVHSLLSKAVVKSKPKVLWCYRDELELSSHSKMRAKQVKKLQQKGDFVPEEADAFSQFVKGIQHCRYKDSERILGDTVGMLVLQVSLLEENIKPRTDLPPLLVHLRERRPEKLHYIGVSFGLTLDLLRFWKKQKFAPFYVGHNPNAVTGEHACMVLKPLDNDDIETRGTYEKGFFSPFYQDFRKKFTWLLGSSSFRTMEYKLAMSVLDPRINFSDMEPASLPTRESSYLFNHVLSGYSMARLTDYVNNLIDFLSISYLDPILATLYFEEKLPVTLSYSGFGIVMYGIAETINSHMLREQ